MIRFIDVNLTSSDDETILKDISFNLPSRGFVFLSGKSGSGKTSLCNLLSGLEKVSFGNIIVAQEDLSTFSDSEMANYRNGMVSNIIQDSYFINELTILENILLAIKLQKRVVNEELHKQIRELFKYFDLSIGLLNKKAFEISVGQLQRANIIRSLMKNNNLLIADEPTGNLDAETSSLVFKKLKEISEEKLVVVVTHDIVLATKYADIIIKINKGTMKDFLVRKNNEISNTSVNSTSEDLDILSYVNNFEQKYFVSKINESSILFKNDNLLDFRSISSDLPSKEVYRIGKSLTKAHLRRNMFMLIINSLIFIICRLALVSNNFLSKIIWYKLSLFKILYLEFDAEVLSFWSTGILGFIFALIKYLVLPWYIYVTAKSFVKLQFMIFYRTVGVSRSLGANKRTINKILLYLFACFMGLFALIQQISFFLVQKVINLVRDNDFNYYSVFIDRKLIPGLKHMSYFEQKESLIKLSQQVYQNVLAHALFDSNLCSSGFFSLSPNYRDIIGFIGLFIFCLAFVWFLYTVLYSNKLNKEKPLMMLKKDNKI
ncbi:MAG: ABC transporter ATP-binding protein [Candidatus Phytoplasma australasiaticum]|nr:ABC transporter ATP-binding protein [Candidatus Phytoplasma australasiaticum]